MQNPKDGQNTQHTHTHTHTNTHFKVDSIQKELENVKQELGALISVSFQSSVFSEIFQRL